MKNEKKGQSSRLLSFEGFISKVLELFEKFVSEIEAKCKEKLADELEILTQIHDWKFISEVEISSPEASLFQV